MGKGSHGWLRRLFTAQGCLAKRVSGAMIQVMSSAQHRATFTQKGGQSAIWVSNGPLKSPIGV